MKVGIITYHAAYNFGSALQAYATLHTIGKLGADGEIINYRMIEQKKFYGMYRTSYGKMNFLQDALQFPEHNKRKIREKNFEKFFVNYMNLTEEFSEPEQIVEITRDYDVVVSGSDQIWNKHSCELTLNEWKYMDPYLLKNVESKKVSYATSVGHMSDKELEYISSDINKYKYLSMREKRSADKISELIKRKIEVVLDPTFLLESQEWINSLELEKKKEKPFILYYSLKRFNGNNNLKEVKKIAKDYNYQLKYVTPFSYCINATRAVENHIEYGPKEFLVALYNAELVITDSFHGTILSVNFGKKFFSICADGGAEFRKVDVLKQLGLENRIVNDVKEIKERVYEGINYIPVKMKLDIERKKSIDFFKKALFGR